MNQLSVHTHAVQWSGSGIAPWGDVERNETGEIPVVLYFKTGDSYCYDALFSPELRTLLERSSKPEITVQYNVFRTFGQEKSYNIRSVEGLQFNDDEHTIRPGESYGGQPNCPPTIRTASDN